MFSGISIFIRYLGITIYEIRLLYESTIGNLLYYVNIFLSKLLVKLHRTAAVLDNIQTCLIINYNTDFSQGT